MKGAFTGAEKDREGLLKRANSGMLFLDEVHRLDRVTAGMLLTALETNHAGSFSFAPLGVEEKVESKFQPVFASNQSLEVLRQRLGEDFVDRISQRIIEMPRIQDDELLDAWREVWDEMRFTDRVLDPTDDEEGFISWLRKQPLDGSFRDLQHIAILVADHQRYQAWSERRSPGPIRNQTLLEWLDQEMKKRLPPPKRMTVPVPVNVADQRLTENAFLDECKHAFTMEMRDVYGSSRSAVEELRSRGSRMTAAKFSRWLKLGDQRA